MLSKDLQFTKSMKATKRNEFHSAHCSMTMRYDAIWSVQNILLRKSIGVACHHLAYHQLILVHNVCIILLNTSSRAFYSITTLYLES